MGLPQMFLTKFWLYRTLKVRESSLTAAFTRCVQFPATLTSARSRTWSWPSRPSPKRASSGSWSRFRRSSHSTFVVMTRFFLKSPLQAEARTKFIKLSYRCHFPEEEIVNLNGRIIVVKRRNYNLLLLSYFLRGAISVSLQPIFKQSLFYFPQERIWAFRESSHCARSAHLVTSSSIRVTSSVELLNRCCASFEKPAFKVFLTLMWHQRLNVFVCFDLSLSLCV